MIETGFAKKFKGSKSLRTLLVHAAGDGRDFISLIAFEVLKMTARNSSI